MSQVSDAPIAGAGTLDAKPSMSMDVRLRLSVMMFLEFAVWGSWFVVLGRYLDVGLHFTGTEIGSVYGTMALGAIISMMVAGQLADRVMASEYLMAIFHLVGAALLFALTRVHTFHAFWGVAFAYSLMYNPTLAIANSLSFANIPDATRDFPRIRVLGTAGWIAAGFAVDFVLPKGSDVTNRPLLLAAALSAVLGVFSFALPHTPPSREQGDALPFLRAFGLLRDFSFAIFFGLSFAITIALAFYYGFTNVFLGDVGVEKIATVMTIGQWSELGFMLLLPFALRRFGMKWVLAVGMAAWALRYAIFALPHPPTMHVLGTRIPGPVLLFGLALHGVCFDFFLAAGFIYTDEKAPKSIRGSAQALFSFLTYGVGMWIGNEVSGRVVDHYKFNGVTDWTKVWLVPAIGAAACLLLFVLIWRDKPIPKEVAA